MHLEEEQRLMRERHSGKKKERLNNGQCYSKFGRANSDTRPVLHSSIRQWGEKIKARRKKSLAPPEPDTAR